MQACLVGVVVSHQGSLPPTPPLPALISSGSAGWEDLVRRVEGVAAVAQPFLREPLAGSLVATVLHQALVVAQALALLVPRVQARKSLVAAVAVELGRRARGV